MAAPFLQTQAVFCLALYIHIYLSPFVGNLVGQIVDRMQKKIKDEALIIPGTNLVLYSAVSFMCLIFDVTIMYIDTYIYRATVLLECNILLIA